MSRFLVLCFTSGVFAGGLQNSPSCDTVEACRQLALETASRGDFETFHDFAWLAVRKGRPNDPELMHLLARAQSLSGRPHDSLVMLRRLAGLGVVPTDVETDGDFRRVRALPGWADVAALMAASREEKTAAEPAPVPERASLSKTPPAPEPAFEPPTVGTSSPPVPPVAEPLSIPRPSFAPVGLAYDAVSRRFIAGDRRVNKLMVLDEEFRRVNDLAAAASAGFFGLTAVEIDRRRGDLWVANAREDGSETALHRLQLISGRVLQVMRLPAAHGRASFADVSLTPSGTVLALDTLGSRVFPLRAGSYRRPLPIQAGGLLSIAALDEHTACIATVDGLLRADLASQKTAPVRAARGVNLKGLAHIRAHQGSLIAVQRDGERARIVRVRLDRTGARAVAAEIIEEVAIAHPTAMAIAGGVLHYLSRDADGGTTVRHITLARAR